MHRPTKTNMSLLNKIKYYNRNQCPVQLSSASGNTIDIMASGIEHKLVGTTYLSNVDTDLISGLQSRGLD